ncbi:hypothetical protein EDB19DRAFT_1915704 [Suillus lakei]|nr:hypothetical protein EDB19DRAFT_1915704 [Suillus lakei]
MTNIHQAAQVRPEHIVILFGFLHFHYSKIENAADLAARTAVLASAEHYWGQCNQEVFIAACHCQSLLQDFTMLKDTPHNISDAPLDLYMELEDYMSGSCDFVHVDIYKYALLSHAKMEGTAVDPIDIWAGLSYPGSPLRPLHSIALRLLSICPNSTSCERLFSIFGAILTKWRNQLSTETLTLLAELKMYVHEEHVHNNVIKKQLKHWYCDEKEPTEMLAVNDSDAGNKNLIQAVNEEEAFSATEMMQSAPATDSFTCIAISELLDYSHTEEWLGSFYKTAIQGLDAKLKLYKLLNIDAEGIEDLEFPQVDDVLIEKIYCSFDVLYDVHCVLYHKC